jgi:hypothetical protein
MSDVQGHWRAEAGILDKIRDHRNWKEAIIYQMIPVVAWLVQEYQFAHIVTATSSRSTKLERLVPCMIWHRRT